MIERRNAKDRGHALHGWLDSWHSFSFANYHDPQHMGWGPLRVINEDRIAPGAGFGMHSHRDMEIISYVLAGELAHEDSMGTGSVIRPGEVQKMSAGTGVHHSEFNHAQAATHFLQIWIQPNQQGVVPDYQQRTVPDSAKRGALFLIAGPCDSGAPISLHQDAFLYAGLFTGSETAALHLKPKRLSYVHLIRGSLDVNGQQLEFGDALKLSDEAAVHLHAGHDAEVLVFNLPP